jgi:anti-anti-sigma factor
MNLDTRRTFGKYRCITIEGRIDGSTSGVLDKAFDHEAEKGHHQLIADFNSVSYISSAGLRVFLKAQKKLRSVGGEVVLTGLKDTAADVFRVAGMLQLFRTVSSPAELADEAVNETSAGEVSTDQDGEFTWIRKGKAKGNYSGIGNFSKLRGSRFSADDIVSISQSSLSYAVGLAASGNLETDCLRLFGESLVVDHHFFNYPAMDFPAVDYLWYSGENPSEIHFLYGLKFSGEFGDVIRFNPREPVSLKEITDRLAGITGSDFFGWVMICKCEGIYSLNLKKIPWAENAPSCGDIMDESVFPDWFNFPVEDTDLNKTMIVVGIFSREGNEVEVHAHGLLFSKGLVSRSGFELIPELERIIRSSEPLKVVHLMEESRFSYGLAGVIPL